MRSLAAVLNLLLLGLVLLTVASRGLPSPREQGFVFLALSAPALSLYALYQQSRNPRAGVIGKAAYLNLSLFLGVAFLTFGRGPGLSVKALQIAIAGLSIPALTAYALLRCTPAEPAAGTRPTT